MSYCDIVSVIIISFDLIGNQLSFISFKRKCSCQICKTFLHFSVLNAIYQFSCSRFGISKARMLQYTVKFEKQKIQYLGKIYNFDLSNTIKYHYFKYLQVFVSALRTGMKIPVVYLFFFIVEMISNIRKFSGIVNVFINISERIFITVFCYNVSIWNQKVVSKMKCEEQ